MIIWRLINDKNNNCCIYDRACIGRFFLQTEKLAKRKKEKYDGVIIHSIIYAIVVAMVEMFFLEGDFGTLMLLFVIITASHFAVDSFKHLMIKNRKIDDCARTFFIDQMIHIAIMVLGPILLLEGNEIVIRKCIDEFVANIFSCNIDTALGIIISVLVILRPTNIVVKKCTENRNGLNVQTGESNNDSRNGRKVGIVERLILLILLIENQYVAIGFVLTAKSVARYDKIVNNEKFAEYYLLGTLISALSVLLCKILFI